MAANQVLARVADVASSDLLDFIEATCSDCSLSTTSVNRRGLPSMPRAEWYQWPEKLGPRLVEKSRENWSSGSEKLWSGTFA